MNKTSSSFSSSEGLAAIVEDKKEKIERFTVDEEDEAALKRDAAGKDTTVVEEEISPTSSSTSSLSMASKKAILNYHVPWPICQFHPQSKRARKILMSSSSSSSSSLLSESLFENAFRMKSIFDKLKGWCDKSEIAIDGMNGTGKTSLCRMMNNRIYCKINEHPSMSRQQKDGSITSGSDYNYKPINCIEYAMLQSLTRVKKSSSSSSSAVGKGVVWDRYIYSNLVFYLVHQLMAVYGNRDVPKDSSKVYPFLNDFAVATNLYNTIDYMRSVKSIPLLILVNSNLESVALAMTRRGGLNDITNAKEYNYQRAQEHCFRYIGRILGAVVIDVGEFVGVRKIDGKFTTLGDVQDELIKRLDYRRNVELKHLVPVTLLKVDNSSDDDDDDGARSECRLEDILVFPERFSANVIAEYNKSANDTLIYNHSLK